jgi:hypothetical protein
MLEINIFLLTIYIYIYVCARMRSPGLCMGSRFPFLHLNIEVDKQEDVSHQTAVVVHGGKKKRVFKYVFNHVSKKKKKKVKATSRAREGNLDEPKSSGCGSDAPADGGLDVS